MKRHHEDIPGLVEAADVLLLDIEGTTTSISFVKDELFPYIRRQVKAHLEATWDDEETQKDVKALTRQISEDLAACLAGSQPLPEEDDEGPQPLIDALVANVLTMMDADRKVAPLKTLQGHMWRRAYEAKEVKGHVYEDVVPTLETIRKSGKKIIIYSSGSVAAQKLLFGHSAYGNLLHLFDGHFDTNIGPKVESESYTKILRQLSCDPASLLFITDLAKEAWAARAAGVHVLLSVREGTAPLSEEDVATFPVITSFEDLLRGPAGKRRKEEEEEEEEEEEDLEEEEEENGEGGEGED